MKMRRNNHNMKRNKYLPLFWGLSFFLLAGCGGTPQPVESYSAGEDSVPALNQVVTLDDGFQYGTSENDEGATSFQYTALTSGSQVAQAYAKDLVDKEQCVLMDTDGQLLPDDYSFPDSGTIEAAKESSDETGLFQLSISWDSTTCTISPALVEGGQLPQKEDSSMTLEEAVVYLESLPPSYLGLDGTDMSDYIVFPEDGLSVLDDKPCLCLNVYSADAHQYVATYLIAEPGRQIYQLDRETGEAHPLAP